MTDAARVRLLHGPYRPPALRRGDIAFCLYRDGEVVVTGWSDGRIPWPMCIRRGGRAQPGLLVTDELRRAVERESSAAVQHWWGVSDTQVWRWRKALGVGRYTEGSRRLQLASSAKGAAVLRGQKLPPDQVERLHRVAAEHNLVRNIQPCPAPGGSRPWTPDELALLGTMSDAEVAAKVGRPESAVRVRRAKAKLPTFRDRRRRAPG